jgi:hypothetical protein
LTFREAVEVHFEGKKETGKESPEFLALSSLTTFAVKLPKLPALISFKPPEHLDLGAPSLSYVNRRSPIIVLPDMNSLVPTKGDGAPNPHQFGRIAVGAQLIELMNKVMDSNRQYIQLDIPDPINNSDINLESLPVSSIIGIRGQKTINFFPFATLHTTLDATGEPLLSRGHGNAYLAIPIASTSCKQGSLGIEHAPVFLPMEVISAVILPGSERTQNVLKHLGVTELSNIEKASPILIARVFRPAIEIRDTEVNQLRVFPRITSHNGNNTQLDFCSGKKELTSLIAVPIVNEVYTVLPQLSHNDAIDLALTMECRKDSSLLSGCVTVNCTNQSLSAVPFYQDNDMLTLVALCGIRVGSTERAMSGNSSTGLAVPFTTQSHQYLDIIRVPGVDRIFIGSRMQKQCDIDAVNADGYPKETGLAVQVFKKYPSSLSRGSECNDFFKMYHKHVQTESDDDLESFGTSGLLSLLSTKKEVVVVPERGDQYRVSTSKVSFNLMFFHNTTL